jgi:hypothetical protein
MRGCPRVAVPVLCAVLVWAAASGLSAGRDRDLAAVFTAEQAAAGRIEIQKNAFGACTDCHTTTLTGRTGAPGELPPFDSLSADYQQLVKNNGGIVPPFVGADFVQKWRPRTTQDLIKEFEDRFAPPGSRMTRETRLNLIAYILQANGASAGTQPLTPDTDVILRKVIP